MARILVVDDDEEILTLAERVLSHAGHSVVIATDAIKAMDILNQVNFDLLISDANMPHYTGFDLIKTVRNSKRFEDMGVAMLTSLRGRKDVEKAVNLGADDYIVKPIDPLLFIEKIDSLFEKKPPGQHPEVQLDPQSELAHCYVKSPVSIRAISELGVELESAHTLKEGTTVELVESFWERELRCEAPPCKVLSQQESDLGTWITQAVFVGATEFQLGQIRKWIISQNPKMKDSSELKFKEAL